MTSLFSIRTTAHFDRTFKKLSRRHSDLPTRLTALLPILRTEPYNRSRSHPIRKLAGIPAGEGRYRLRSGRFRFRYDIEGQVVYLKACAL